MGEKAAKVAKKYFFKDLQVHFIKNKKVIVSKI